MSNKCDSTCLFVLSCALEMDSTPYSKLCHLTYYSRRFLSLGEFGGLLISCMRIKDHYLPTN